MFSTSCDEQNKTYPDYCQTIQITDPNGIMKELVFPKALDLDRPKRARTTFSREQLQELEAVFTSNQYLVGRERSLVSRKLQLSETQIKVWFQNRRTKHKRQQNRQMEYHEARAESMATQNLMKIFGCPLENNDKYSSVKEMSQPETQVTLSSNELNSSNIAATKAKNNECRNLCGYTVSSKNEINTFCHRKSNRYDYKQIEHSTSVPSDIVNSRHVCPTLHTYGSLTTELTNCSAKHDSPSSASNLSSQPYSLFNDFRHSLHEPMTRCPNNSRFNVVRYPALSPPTHTNIYSTYWPIYSSSISPWLTQVSNSLY